MSEKRVKAFGYTRTSSATNVDGDSIERQRVAITAFAEAHGFEIVEFYNDPAISGSDQIHSRPGFSAMLAAIAGNGVRTIVCESPDRFSRDTMIGLAGHDYLKGQGIALIPASAPTFFTEDNATSKLIRTILMAVADFDRAMTVAKLAGARKRMKIATGKCEGRKGFAELAERDEGLSAAIMLARSLRASGASLRAVAKALADAGHVSATGKVYTAKSVAAMTAA